MKGWKQVRCDVFSGALEILSCGLEGCEANDALQFRPDKGRGEASTTFRAIVSSETACNVVPCCVGVSKRRIA
eukprot:5476709-Pyramimonas_sp.AAC.1